MSTLKRIVKFAPAYDKRNPDPSKNYGVHGVELRMVLKGKEGAVQFLLFTNWMLPRVQLDTDLRILSKASKGVRLVPSVSKELGPLLTKVSKDLECAERLADLRDSEELDLLDLQILYHPMPVDLGYHSPKPLYEDQTQISDSCEYLDGRPCYYDGSGLNAKSIYEVLLKEGDKGVWRELEEYYKLTFNVKEEL